jgi:hypothetical protein
MALSAQNKSAAAAELVRKINTQPCRTGVAEEVTPEL